MKAIAPHAGQGLRPATSRSVAANPKRPIALRLWLPATPIFLLLSPLVFAVALIASLTPARRKHVLGLARAVGSLLLSLSGTSIRLESPKARIHIRIL